MTIKISAVIDGRKFAVVIEGEVGDVLTAIKMAVTQQIAGQMPWLSSLEISEG